MSVHDLVDARTGLVTSLARQPADPRLPFAWVGHGATVSRADRFAPWRADGFGFGASAGDPVPARLAACGEAVERYCGNAVPERLVRASHASLTARGLRAVDPDDLALYSPAQHAAPGFPFRPFTRHDEVLWADGTDLHDGGPVLVPASLAWLDFVHGSRAHEVPRHSLAYSGIAAGTDRRMAERNALEELWERDACAIWWASGASTRAVDDGGRITGALGWAEDATTPPVRIRLLEVPSESPAPVVAAFLEEEHPDGSRLVAFGSACRSTPEHAATKALVEALGLLQLTRQLVDPASEVWRAVRAGGIEEHVFLPYRADRRYLDDVGPGCSRLTDLPPVAQLHLDPRMSGAHLDRLRPTATATLEDLPRIDADEPMPAHLEALARLDMRAVSVDLTTPDVRLAGLEVVRVVVPGLVGNGPPAYPLRGSDRYLDVPRRLGFDRVPASADDLVPDPIPLA
ncbi:bacteriocin biosynthesis protein SagD [Clavibacter michiganensis]|uniref:Bacteriocin biosynthesis protein SagD n=1 Tax=Clavibacter michiganensis TaxID=28447 RepID=A0A2S5VTV5_9MICO|nr:YcaO-like family protein [Clavibacter michiganensis]PPF67819.1 bacteriocin biosynthesis protein SagD [Clavibacter michiganensis]